MRMPWDAPVYGMLRAANNGGERRTDDFYPSPSEPTRALVPKLRNWPRTVWEPACGDGGIGLPLEQAGFQVMATDLIYRGYGKGGVNFLSTKQRSADALVTNPPYGKLVTRFITHALDLEIPQIAMLLNVNVWHAERRTKLWNRRQPEVIYALTWRPDWTGSGNPYFNAVWTVWGPQSAPFTRYELLQHPGISATMPWENTPIDLPWK